MMRWLDLFSGIGGFAAGLQMAGFPPPVAFCEIDQFCRRVLQERWPEVPVHRDVRELAGDAVRPVELICGGFPCQDISEAGRRKGIEGSRSGLWSEYARLIGELRPDYAIVENVPGLLRRGIDRVLGDLATLGYDAEWHCIPASAVGAPHRRDRVWVIAYTVGTGMEGPLITGNIGVAGSWGWRGKTDLQEIFDSPFVPTTRWPQPLLRNVDDGVPEKVARLTALGNSVVPQIVSYIGAELAWHRTIYG